MESRCHRWLCALVVASALLRPAGSQAATADDGLIVFAAALVPDALSVRFGGIYAVRPDGTGLRQLTRFETVGFLFRNHALTLPDDHPSLSPDGRRVVFNSNRASDGLLGDVFGGNQEIFVMQVDGTGITRLTTSDGADTEPVFSPDGTQIAFVSTRQGNADIWLMRADGSNPRPLTAESEDQIEPAWSRDGRRIAFTRVVSGGVLQREEKDVWVMRADGTGARPVITIDGEDHDAVFLNATQMVITSERDGTPPFGDTFVVDVGSDAENPERNSFVRNLTDEVRFGGGDPSISPDRNTVVFFRSATRLISNLQLWTASITGTRARRIANVGLLNVHPHWGVLADSDGDGDGDYIDAPALTPAPRADVGIALVPRDASVRRGADTVVEMRVLNRGPATAQDVDAEVVIPEGFELLPTTGAKHVVAPDGSAQTVALQLGALPVGRLVTRSIALRASCHSPAGSPSAVVAAAVAAATDDADVSNNAEEEVLSMQDAPPRILALGVPRDVVRVETGRSLSVPIDLDVEDECAEELVCELVATMPVDSGRVVVDTRGQITVSPALPAGARAEVEVRAGCTDPAGQRTDALERFVLEAVSATPPPPPPPPPPPVTPVPQVVPALGAGAIALLILALGMVSVLAWRPCRRTAAIETLTLVCVARCPSGLEGRCARAQASGLSPAGGQGVSWRRIEVFSIPVRPARSAWCDAAR